MPETGQVVKLRLECLECAAHEYRRVRPRLSVRVGARRQQESAANVNEGRQDGSTTELTLVGRVKREI